MHSARACFLPKERLYAQCPCLFLTKGKVICTVPVLVSYQRKGYMHSARACFFSMEGVRGKIIT